MPTYEYRCKKCANRVSIRHAMFDPGPFQCPLCGSEDLKRLISRVTVVKSGQERTRDLSWIDRDMGQRMRKQVSGKVNPVFGDTLDRMESS